MTETLNTSTPAAEEAARDPEFLYGLLTDLLGDYRRWSDQIDEANGHGEATHAMDLREDRVPVAEEIVEVVAELDAKLRDRQGVPFAWRVPAWRRWLRRFAA